MNNSTRVMKITHDDWHPSYKLDGWIHGSQNVKLVEVSFLKLTNGEWRTCVWGADDSGMEYDSKNRRVAWRKFLAVVAMESVSRNALRNLGFINA